MDPWKSWAIVGIVGAGAAYYYSQSGKPQKGRGQTLSILADQSQRRDLASKNDSKDTRKKKSKGKVSEAADQASSDLAEASSTSVKPSPTEKAMKRKKGKQQPSKLAQSSAVEVSNGPDIEVDADDAEDQGMSNKEFAMQLSGLKTGTSLKKPDTANKENKKTRKQGKSTEMPAQAANGAVPKPNGILNAQEASAASSTTGADADDDLSLPVSPEFGATQATTPSGADVSDMLESPANGPSVLRLTEPLNQQPPRQPKAQKPKAEPETKKQRQNRQKNEEKKALREEAEKERRALLEKQLRTSREAEGRPAKNGISNSKGPSVSAWDHSARSSASDGAENTAPSSKTHDGPLLDTFDEDKSFLDEAPREQRGALKTLANGQANAIGDVAITDDEAKGKASSKPAGDHAWADGVPAEEEQTRLMNEIHSDDAWKTVTKGKGKKRSTTVTSADTDRPTSSGSSERQVNSYKTKSSPSPANSSSANSNNLSAPKSSASSEMADTDSLPAVAKTANIENTGNGQRGKLSGTASKRPQDPRTEFPHLDFEGGTFRNDDINDKGVSKFFKGKLLPNGKPDYKDPDYARHWVPGMSVHPIYSPRSRHPGFREDGVTVRETFETIDHSVWTRDNIQEHPDYDPVWPYALTGHPMDSDWAGDWEPSDMEKAKTKSTEQDAAEKAERKTRRGKEDGDQDEHANDD